MFTIIPIPNVQKKVTNVINPKINCSFLSVGKAVSNKFWPTGFLPKNYNTTLMIGTITNQLTKQATALFNLLFMFISSFFLFILYYKKIIINRLSILNYCKSNIMSFHHSDDFCNFRFIKFWCLNSCYWIN